MKSRFIRAVALILMATSCHTSHDYGKYYDDIEFSMPVLQRPVFPDNKVKPEDFGGVPDGITLNTEAFGSAIAALSEMGGGTLVVSDGIWFTGPIELRSNIELHLENGALILFSPDHSLYPMVTTVFEGTTFQRSLSPISATGCENIAITGSGSIDGSGEAWRPLKRAKVTEGYWKQVTASGGYVDGKTWYPLGDGIADTLSAEWFRALDRIRPTMVKLTECRNILLEGVTFENSPSWNIHPLMCENLIIDNITVRNPYWAQNGDGLDLESCKNVIVAGSTFDVGDDAICLKSGKDEEGRRRGIPTENVIIRDCRVFHAHGGFVVGSEMSGGVRNVSVADCQFFGTDIGLRFKSTRGRGGVVENIYVDGVVMSDIVYEPISFNLYYFVKDPDANKIIPPVDDTTPEFRNIFIKNVTSNASDKAMLFNGLPEMNIRNVNIENSVFHADRAGELIHADGMVFDNVDIHTGEGPVLILDNAKNISLEGLNGKEGMNRDVVVNNGNDDGLPEHLRQAYMND